VKGEGKRKRSLIWGPISKIGPDPLVFGIYWLGSGEEVEPMEKEQRLEGVRGILNEYTLGKHEGPKREHGSVEMY